MKNISSKFGIGFKFQNGTKHKKIKSAISRFNLNVREHERVNLLSTERCCGTLTTLRTNSYNVKQARERE